MSPPEPCVSSQQQHVSLESRVATGGTWSKAMAIRSALNAVIQTLPSSTDLQHCVCNELVLHWSEYSSVRRRLYLPLRLCHNRAQLQRPSYFENVGCGWEDAQMINQIALSACDIECR